MAELERPAEKMLLMLAEQMRLICAAENTQENRARLRGVRDLAKRIARAEAKGWFIQADGLALPAPEQLVEARKFHPDQLTGLKEVGITFSMEAQSVSVGQLWEDEATKPLFGHVTSSQQMRDIVPVARDVAVNSQQIFVPGGENLSFDDQRQHNEDYVRGLRKRNLKNGGTLDGVEFGMDHASVLAQLDFEHQKRFNGKKLVVGGFGRTIDETSVDPEFGPHLAGVGRDFRGHRLYVPAWGAPATAIRMSGSCPWQLLLAIGN